MYKNKKVAVVVPCFNEGKQVTEVVVTMPTYVDFIICVNDCSTDNTIEVLLSLKAKHPNLRILDLPKNVGVGGAIDAGYGLALELGAELVGVMAGDGQMDPIELSHLIEALLLEKASYSKITRLYEQKYLQDIPRVRRIGNSILSTLTRLSSGYWNMSDSQTGFTVITREALGEIQGELWTYYGFPNDVLNKLGLNNHKIVEIPSKPIYGVGEESKLKPQKVAWPIFKLLVRGIKKRIRIQFFTRTLHPIGIGYLGSAFGLLLGSFWILKIFVFQFLVQHNTQPLELISAFFLAQSSLLILWLSLMFDALSNRGNCVLLRAQL